MGLYLPLLLTGACIFLFFTFTLHFLNYPEFQDEWCCMCNMFRKTVSDENIDISTKIHNFTSKNENFIIKCTIICKNHNIFERVVNRSLYLSSQT